MYGAVLARFRKIRKRKKRRELKETKQPIFRRKILFRMKTKEKTTRKHDRKNVFIQDTV